MADRRGRAGRPWERAKAHIKATATHCAKCGGILHPELKWPHPMSTSIGHQTPLAHGGDPLDLNNLAAEHLTCNVAEGARMTNRQRQGVPYSQRTSYTNDDW